MKDQISDRVISSGKRYLSYLESCLEDLKKQESKLDTLYGMIESANGVHFFGFGRSGAAALSLAIRLRHFCEYLPPAWWIGDAVRPPIREQDLVILFSGSGERQEVNRVADKAKSTGANIVVITGKTESWLSHYASLVIILPGMEEQDVYGGGDFELAAYFFQELFVTSIGQKKNIPTQSVERNHV
jgi:D-arabinose 5-phosphate isomerase GutQ